MIFYYGGIEERWGREERNGMRTKNIHTGVTSPSEPRADRFFHIYGYGGSSTVSTL